MKYWILAFVLLSWTLVMTSAELCTSDICEYHFVVRRTRSMTYSAETAAFDVKLNGTKLQLVANAFRDEHSLIGNFVDAADVITTDGHKRDVITINDQFPGPTIEVMKDAQVVVHVKNELAVEGTTIHWHGLLMRHTPWMDGTAYITQCPILPSQTFTYRFQADPPGTHWYHSHIDTQKLDGLYGLFIVHDRPPTLPSYGITVIDWQPADAITTAIENPRGWTRGTGEFSNFYSALINGRGRYNEDPHPLTEFKFTQDQRYRFRVVHAGAKYTFLISIDDHQLDVVGSDGDEYSPMTVDFIIILPGESIDFEVTATKSTGSYWLRAEVSTKNNRLYPDVDDKHAGAQAIIRYDAATSGEDDPTSEARSCSEQSPCQTFNCPYAMYPPDAWVTCIVMSDARSVNSEAFLDQTFGLKDDDSDLEEVFLNLGFPVGASINARKSVDPRAPMFTKDIEKYIVPCDDDVCDREGCICTHIKELPFNKTIQMVVSRYGGSSFLGYHTVHLHGHDFAVLKMGFPEQNETNGYWTGKNRDIVCADGDDRVCSRPEWNGQRPKLNKDRPPLKNNVMVPANGYVVVRFRSDNPGYWFVHCHQQSHMQEGMNMLFHEAPGMVQAVPDDFPTCKDFDWNDDQYQSYRRSTSNYLINHETTMLTASAVTKSTTEVKDTNMDRPMELDVNRFSMSPYMAIGVAFAFTLMGAILATIPCAIFMCCTSRKDKFAP